MNKTSEIVVRSPEFFRQHVLCTVENLEKCPKCGNPLKTVMRDFGKIESYCIRWKIEKIRCGYYKVRKNIDEGLRK